MGSLCGQVNMAWRMNRSTVTLFLFPLSKSRLDWNERWHKKNAKPKTNQQCSFSLNTVRYQWFPLKVYQPLRDQNPRGCWCCWTIIQMRISGCCGCIVFLKICGVAKAVLVFFTVLYFSRLNKINLSRQKLNHYLVCASPQSDPCLSVTGLCHASNPPLLT